MLNRWLKLLIFLLFSAVLIAYPLWENLHVYMEKPVQMKFSIRASDPCAADGSSLFLIPEPTTVDFPNSSKPIISCRYAVLRKDSDGFGRVVELVSKRPVNGALYVNTQYYGCRKNSFGTYEHRIRLPFQTILFQPKLTIQEVKRLNAKLEQSPESFLIVVNIYSGGLFHTEDLLVDGIPFRKWLSKPEVKK